MTGALVMLRKPNALDHTRSNANVSTTNWAPTAKVTLITFVIQYVVPDRK